MSLVLARVDQRLIHGQVLVGWVPVVRPDVLLVADDASAGDSWAAEMMVEAAAPVLEARVLSLDEASEAGLYSGDRRVLLLTASLEAMLTLARGGVPLIEVNLGGLHYREGARRLLDYVFLDREDIEALGDLAARGIRLKARDLPSGAAVDVSALLSEGRLDYDALPVS